MGIFNTVADADFCLPRRRRADMQAKAFLFGEIILLIAMGALKTDMDSRFTVVEITQAVSQVAHTGRSHKVLTAYRVE
ncbi:MAG: hypothetical protein ACI9W7_001876 [Porticoccaceae bacterium]|jgi:hypothetical protein|tara:strand:+ start:3250 stop:3483 length:234 start_codon:yes stop_codon:yes gene_type:complete